MKRFDWAAIVGTAVAYLLGLAVLAGGAIYISLSILEAYAKAGLL